MHNKEHLKKIIIILALIIFGLFSAYYLVYRDIKGKNENISSLVQDLDFESSRQKYLLSTKKMIENISSDIERINRSIVEKGGDVSFIENLEVVAKDNGLQISIDSLVIEESPTLSEIGVTTLFVKAKTIGSWSGTYNFVAQVEALPLKIKIDRLSLQASAGSTSSEWNSSIEIRVLKNK